jgi:hypothetical protein
VSDCFACQLADKNPRTGAYRGACVECAARALANGPVYFDADRAGALTQAYRAALVSVFGADWKAGHERVRVWAKKI